jgi:hypothetical protein
MENVYNLVTFFWPFLLSKLRKLKPSRTLFIGKINIFGTPSTCVNFIFSLVYKIWCLVIEFHNKKQMGCEWCLCNMVFLVWWSSLIVQIWTCIRYGHSNNTCVKGPCLELWNIHIFVGLDMFDFLHNK